MSDVMFFELNSNDMRKLMNGMYETYSKLIVYAQEAYKKSRGKKGILNIEAIAQEDDNFNENFNQLMTEHFKNFFSKENAVLPLFNGYNYQDISDSGKTYLSLIHIFASLLSWKSEVRVLLLQLKEVP